MNIWGFINNLIFKVAQHQMLSNGVGASPGGDDLVSNSSTTSSLDVFFKNLIDKFVNSIINFGEVIYRCFAKIVYFLVKICLNIMDLTMVIINSLTGQATAFDLSKNSNLTETDVLFRFLLNETTLKILRRVFYFSLLLLLIATIVAIVKNEWDKNASGKGMSHMQFFRKVLMSLFWMFLTPFVLIVGILAVNVLLASGLNALQGNNKTAFSVGSTIFTASTYDANWYRKYADENKRVPIIFDYNGGFYSSQNGEPIITTDTSSSNTDAQIRAILTNENITSGQATYNMFENESFFDFNYISDNSYYYNVYDGEYLKPKRIEYYVMADFIDFAMESGATFYVVNVEDIYETAINILKRNLQENENINLFITEEGEKGAYYDCFSNILNTITPYGNENDNEKPLISASEVVVGTEPDYIGIKNLATEFLLSYDSSAVDNYKFNVYYDEKLLTGIEKESAFNYIPESNEYYMSYTSLARARDEADGAKFLFCTLEEIENENGEKDYLYLPVTNNFTVNKYYNFSSEYLSDAMKDKEENVLRNESLFVAKGGFTEQGYPTAIRQDGENIVFYRHTAGKPTLLCYLPTFSYSDDGGTSSASGSSILNYITGVDISSLVPDIRIQLGAIATYTKDINNVNTLENGEYVLNYSFVNSGLGFDNVYDATRINFVILVLACLTLMFTLTKIIFVLIKRIFEITIFWITYPGFIAVNPLEKGDTYSFATRFGKWRTNVISRLFYVWGVYLGLAFYYLLIPIIMQLDFSIEMRLPDTNAFSFLSPTMVTWFIKTMFILVLFGMLKILDGYLIDMITPGMQTLGEGGATIEENADLRIKEIKSTTNLALEVYNPKTMIKKAGNKLVETGIHTVRMIPGSGIASDMVAGGTQVARNVSLSNTRRRFVKDTRTSTSDAAVRTETTALQSATTNYNDKSNNSTAQNISDKIDNI